jgi:deoxyribose-phosphate aldolase
MVSFGKDFMAGVTHGTAPGTLAAMIDHTLLKPEATQAEIEILCKEAATYNFASVCVNPWRVNFAANQLHETGVAVGTVIGFPLGANASAVKAMEVIRALADGATELDMVLNLGALREGKMSDVEGDIKAVVKAAQGRLVKVILETCLLSNEEIVSACKAAENAGAGFVKTSTGFAKPPKDRPAGATVEAVRLMHKTVGGKLGIKASGGIRDRATMLELIEAGATRIGTSSGVALIKEELVENEY